MYFFILRIVTTYIRIFLGVAKEQEGPIETWCFLKPWHNLECCHFCLASIRLRKSYDWAQINGEAMYKPQFLSEAPKIWILEDMNVYVYGRG